MEKEAVFKFQKQADLKLGTSKFDTATGTISGVLFALITVIIVVGLGDFENQAPGIKFLVWILVCGAAGFFLGGRYNDNHNKKIAELALRLEGQDYINAKLAKSKEEQKLNDV